MPSPAMPMLEGSMNPSAALRPEGPSAETLAAKAVSGRLTARRLRPGRHIS